MKEMLSGKSIFLNISKEDLKKEAIVVINEMGSKVLEVKLTFKRKGVLKDIEQILKDVLTLRFQFQLNTLHWRIENTNINNFHFLGKSHKDRFGNYGVKCIQIER